MSSRARLRTLLPTARDSVDPERTADVGTRRAFAEDARDSNAHLVRWVLLFLGPLHTLTIVVFLCLDETTPDRGAWASWLVAINAVLLPTVLLGAAIAWTRRPTSLFRVLGDTG